MQIKKNDIHTKVLNAARLEFLNKGYKGTSMRSIAAMAGVSLSNIYNYFASKDEILHEVLAPLMEALDHLMEEHNKPENLSADIFISKEYLHEQINLFVHLIHTFCDELNLLLFHVSGSSFEDFYDRFANMLTEKGLEYYQMMKEKYPQTRTHISEFFFHTMSSWWLSIMGEIVSHKLNEKEIEGFVTEYMLFATAGWKEIMGF